MVYYDERNCIGPV